MKGPIALISQNLASHSIIEFKQCWFYYDIIIISAIHSANQINPTFFSWAQYSKL